MRLKKCHQQAILRLVEEDKKKHFQETATTEERLQAFHEFSTKNRKHGFYLSDSAHKRENLYKDVD